MKIPFVDLKTQYQNLQSEIDQSIAMVINETAFIKGPHVEKFEKEFAKKCTMKHCITVGNGTDAIYIALKNLGIKEGDEVITVANSWIATSQTISQTGAQPVFVDIEPDYYSIDVQKINEKITSKTKAVIPVHLYGQPAQMDAIVELCRTHQLLLVEDCAQAHLAEYQGQKVGSFGEAGTFSFYPGKNLGAYGDAGAIVTNDDTLAQKIRMFANNGCMVKHQHQMEGINSRTDGLQAAILSAKLPHLEDWNRQRFENAKLYEKHLGNISQITLPKLRNNAVSVFHLYVIRTPKRKELMQYLGEQGIATGVHYPTALPFMEAYSYLNHTPKEFPLSYSYQNQILSLPMFPELTEAQISYIAKHVKTFFE